MANDLNQEREAFERAVTAPPFELSIERLPATAAWPGAYRNDATQIAWDFWQERAALAAPAAPQAGEDAASQVEHLDVENHRLRRAMQKIMARLADLLDEDQFGNIESIVTEAGVEPPEHAAQAAPAVAAISDDALDVVDKALVRAWNLGQTYWQHANSEYASQWKKADATYESYQRLRNDTRAALTTQGESHVD